MTGSDLEDIITGRLRSAEQRFTRGRRRVVEVLRDGDGPMTIPQILDEDDALAQSSVYRNLAILEEVGVVTRIVTTDEFSRYELAEDLTEHHHHLICSGCGDVVDFSLDGKTETVIEKTLRTVARRNAFTVDGHRLDIIGHCEACRA